jgi:vacuolar-type H+-ATPase subunit E/Vma4
MTAHRIAHAAKVEAFAELLAEGRTTLEAAIEAAISLLGRIDGDPDLETQTDTCPDDLGERCGDTFLEAA